MPPYLRVVLASACVNAWNSRDICSWVMPMPLSATLISRSSPLRFTTSRTVPFSVNLQALLSRLNSTCRTLVRSACISPASSATSSSRAFLCVSTSGCTVVATSRTIGPTAKVSRNSSILPASIFERSSTPLTSDSRCLPALRILSRSGTNDSTPSSTASSCNSSLYMMTALSGVRSSWLMFARNWLLETLACSASSRSASASRASASASSLASRRYSWCCSNASSAYLRSVTSAAVPSKLRTGLPASSRS